MRVDGLDWLLWNSGLLLVAWCCYCCFGGMDWVVAGFSLGLGLVIYGSSG